jgi:hypothetical protein
MICHRCRGFLVCETFDELRRDIDSLYTRCINCGCIEDAADFYTSREPRLSHKTGISRSTDRQRVTRYSHKRSNQRPEAWLPQTQPL